VGDYIASFLGVSESNAFGLDAFNPIKLEGGSVVTRGEGNHCSVEFNMLYRVCAIPSFLWLHSDLSYLQWHTTTSAVDEEWTEDIFGNTFGKPFDQVRILIFSSAFCFANKKHR
jgi:linoleate 10R-lipoxygenase